MTIFSGISLILFFSKYDFPKLERVIKKVSFYSFIGVLICLFLLVFDFRLKGKYTVSIIGLTFLISTILLFGLTKKNLTKVLSGILTILVFIFGVLSSFWLMGLVFFHLITMLFQPPFVKYQINKTHNVEVREGGFMACGESLVITKSQYGILDKQKYIGNSFCVTGISKIETLEFNENEIEFLIYHDGKTEFKNPYRYKPEIKNVW